MTKTPVRVLVWMPEWQQACCGAAFAVGESVEWNVFELPETDWKRTTAGEAIRHCEDHHAEDHRVLGGVVKNIWPVELPGADGIVRLGAALDGLPAADDMVQRAHRVYPHPRQLRMSLTSNWQRHKLNRSEGSSDVGRQLPTARPKEDDPLRS